MSETYGLWHEAFGRIAAEATASGGLRPLGVIADTATAVLDDWPVVPGFFTAANEEAF